MKEKITKTFELISNFVKPVVVGLDAKITTLIPNPKIKKILYIGVGSLFGFMFLIIIVGILVSPLRKPVQNSGIVLNKPDIIVSSPEPQKELTETQKQILVLENEIKDMQFPDSVLNIPIIERNITVQ